VLVAEFRARQRFWFARGAGTEQRLPLLAPIVGEYSRARHDCVAGRRDRRASASVMLMKLPFIAAMVALYSCTTPVTERETPFEFGKLRANLNGSEFVGAFGRDSIIAIYTPGEGGLQIEGDRQVRGRRPLVRVQMRCATLPKAGIYPIKGLLSPVYVESVLEATAWERAWPLHGRRIRSFLSDSMPPGKLELDTIDTVAGVIRGRFTVALRSFNRAPAETLDIRGVFFGRLSVDHRFNMPQVRWAPEFDRDCERIRDAVSM